MFSASAIHGSRSVALKGEEIHLGSSAFCYLSICDVVFVLSELRWYVHVAFSWEIKSDVIK